MLYNKIQSLLNRVNYTKYRNTLTSILTVCERNYYNKEIEINIHYLKKSGK